MELDFGYSYLLYFRRDSLWQALMGVSAIVHPLRPPSQFLFPGGEAACAPGDLSWEEVDFSNSLPFHFPVVLRFDEDEFVLEYLRALAADDPLRAPPDPEGATQHLLGNITLTVYQRPGPFCE